MLQAGKPMDAHLHPNTSTHRQEDALLDSALALRLAVQLVAEARRIRGGWPLGKARELRLGSKPSCPEQAITQRQALSVCVVQCRLFTELQTR